MIRLISKRDRRGHLTPFYSTVDAGLFPSLPLASNLALRLDATTLNLANGAPIPTWSDTSGLSRNATQISSGDQPTFVTNAKNGLPIVRFNFQYFNFPANVFTSLAEATLFVVVKTAFDPASSDTNSGFSVFGSDSTVGAATAFPFSDGVIYDAFGTTARKTTVNPATTMAQWNIYCVTTRAGNWTSYLNNTQLFTTSSNTVGFHANAVLGRSVSSNGIYPFLGDVGEFIIYNAALSAGDRTTAHAFLKSKWATP